MESNCEHDIVREPERSTPVYEKVNVAVIGGGPSGVAASIAAARNGANVLLVERTAAPGGTGATAFVSEFHSSQNFGGIYGEILERLKVKRGVAANIRNEQFEVSYDPELLRFVFIELLEEAGASVLLHTWAVDTIVEESVVKGVLIENKSGRQAILADVVIDASGDADIAARAGAAMQPYVEPQPMTMIFRMGGVDYDVIEEYARAHPDDFRAMWGIPPNDIDGSKVVHVSGWNSFIERAKAEGILPGYFGNFFSIYGITPAYRKNSIGMIYATRVLYRDPFEGKDLSDAEIEGRKQVRECLPFFQTIPGFQHAFLIDVAPSIGVRDSRRILGDYTLTRDDMFGNVVFEDNILLSVHRGPNVRGWRMHPADGSEGSRDHDRVTGNETAIHVLVHGVPYRALLPRGLERLLVAGKTISMEYEAHARCRDQPECMGFGEAAGVGAAIATRQEITPREVDGRHLRALLMEEGAMNRENVDVEKAKEELVARGREVAGA